MSVLVYVRFVEWTVHLHEYVFGSALVLGVVPDAVYIVGVVVYRTLWVMLVVVVVAGFGAFVWGLMHKVFLSKRSIAGK